MTTPSCPQCSIEMEEGFVPDIGHLNVASTPQWTEGMPERSGWTGLTIRMKERIPITTYRCSRCGLLQSYARLA